MFTSRRSREFPSRRNTKGGRSLYAPIVTILIVIFLIVFSRQNSNPAQQQAGLSGDLPINAPQKITVGDTVNVTIGPVEVNDGTLVGLVMVGKHGPRVYRGMFEQGIAFFTIPGEHTRQPGQIAFIAASESARGEFSMVLHPSTSPLRTDDANLNVSDDRAPEANSTE